MTKLFRLFAVAALSLTAASVSAAPKTYQVTGPVLEVNATTIVVQKGKEKWEIARGTDTKLDGVEPKIGDKVTIEYRMTAATITTKGAGNKPAAANDNADKAADKAAAKADKAAAKAEKAAAK